MYFIKIRADDSPKEMVMPEMASLSIGSSSGPSNGVKRIHPLPVTIKKNTKRKVAGLLIG